MKKALIFNPYLDTLGGGEFFTLSVIKFLINKNFQLDLAWNNKDILNDFYHIFGLNLRNKLNIKEGVFRILKGNNLVRKYQLTKNYDLIFYVSDGSVPFLFGRRNWLLFQSPFSNVGGKNWLNQLKLKNIHKIICYSDFVKKYVDKEFRAKASVIYPTINPIFYNLKPLKKENLILSVGRFDQILNAKKQDILIRIFKKMVDKGLTGWQLVLLGGLKENNSYFLKLKETANSYPIIIKANVDFPTELSFYQKSKIYWHATGFGEDLKLHPEKAEHFGISILEAIACGAIPLVFGTAGPKEIVKDHNFLWLKEEELITKTNLIIDNKISKKILDEELAAIKNNFSIDNFNKRLTSLLNE